VQRARYETSLRKGSWRNVAILAICNLYLRTALRPKTKIQSSAPKSPAKWYVTGDGSASYELQETTARAACVLRAGAGNHCAGLQSGHVGIAVDYLSDSDQT